MCSLLCGLRGICRCLERIGPFLRDVHYAAASSALVAGPATETAVKVMLADEDVGGCPTRRVSSVAHHPWVTNDHC